MNSQHGVVTRAQLLALGVSARSIEHRLANGRLHLLMRGVYAVGRPSVGNRGWWVAAVLACGPEALLSHHSAAALWRIRRTGLAEVRQRDIHVVVPRANPRQRAGIRAHRRRNHDLPGRREIDGIPVTHPVATLVDLAIDLPDGQLEAAVNEADHLKLVDPEQLRGALDYLPQWPGVKRLADLLDGPTVALTTTELERLARDKRRDNAHAGSGLTTLRFSHGQVLHEPDYVRKTLVRAARGRERKRDR